MEKIDYENLNELLSSHLQKDGKVSVYSPRVDANLINGTPSFNATWSWWGFIAGWTFFLYRKMYLVAAVFFVLSIISTAIPFGGFILAIITGASSFYFYTIKFHNDLISSGYGQRDIEDVKIDLKKLGGYNSWVVFVAVVFYSLLIVFSIIPAITAIFATAIF